MPARLRRAVAALLAVCVSLSAGALLAAPAPAAEGKRPVIVSMEWSIGGEVTVGTKINPQSLQTSYEIKVECPDREQCQRAEGQLPAVDEARAVSLTLTDPQRGSTYWFAVIARNSAGEASQRSDVVIPPIPPGSAPNGSKVTESYTPPELPWANQSGNEAAERTVAEQRAKERQEQQDKEAAASRAAEAEALKRNEEEEAEQAFREREEREDREAEHPACVVPALEGDTLAGARRALAKAHCRLGTIHRSAHYSGTLRIVSQSAPRGKQLPAGGGVAVVLGAKRASRRG